MLRRMGFKRFGAFMAQLNLSSMINPVEIKALGFAHAVPS
jgi:hypothetical protein